jgi:uncharacterized protein (TIGR04255 family)
MMALNKSKRVIYKNNVLDKVICQLRFPPILRIDSTPPADFQEIIRGIFPLFSEKVEIIQDLSFKIGPVNSTDPSTNIRKSESRKIYLFSSGDGSCNLNLTRTFLSLTTSRYTKWEDFRDKFKLPIQALLEVYKPPFFTRLGLRYIDIFDRRKLGLDKIVWSELLQPYVLGLLNSPVANDIRSCESKYEIALEDKESILRIITALVDNIFTKERAFLVDSDFYYPKRTEIGEYYDKLEFLHEQADRLISFIITEKLNDAMMPTDLIVG